MTRLNDSHAVVTGGASGIGLAIARALADSGAHVTITSRDTERMQSVVGKHGRIRGVMLDVTDPRSVQKAFESTGPVDILVNNSGTALAAPFERTSLEQLSSIMAVNLTGVFHCMQAVLPAMRERRYGRIVNIASTAGLSGYAYASVYAASKHAVIGLTRSVAVELAQTGITANCVCPGFTDTEIVTTAIANIAAVTGRSEEETLAEFVEHNPQKRLVTPGEVADTVLWLCGENSRSINGQAIAVAGGEIM